MAAERPRRSGEASAARRSGGRRGGNRAAPGRAEAGRLSQRKEPAGAFRNLHEASGEGESGRPRPRRRRRPARKPPPEREEEGEEGAGRRRGAHAQWGRWEGAHGEAGELGRVWRRACAVRQVRGRVCVVARMRGEAGEAGWRRAGRALPSPGGSAVSPPAAGLAPGWGIPGKPFIRSMKEAGCRRRSPRGAPRPQGPRRAGPASSRPRPAAGPRGGCWGRLAAAGRCVGMPLNGGAVPRSGVAGRRRAPQRVSGAVAGLVEGMVSLWRVF